MEHRDPELYQELLNEVNWRQMALGAATGLGLMGGSNAGTPKEKDVSINYSQQDPKQYKQKIINHYRYLKNRNQLANDFTPQKFKPNIELTHIENEYKPEEILLKQIVNPYELIKSGRVDPDKFDRDFLNLNKDNSKDIGFATDPYKIMNNRVLLIVVKDEALKRFNSNTGGYASSEPSIENDKDIKFIVLPESAFKLANGPLKLTQLTEKGKQTLAHELGHTTQIEPPPERSQNNYLDYMDYMNDTNEIGVRLAALKNYMSPDKLKTMCVGNDPIEKIDGTNDNRLSDMKEILKQVTDEKELMKLIIAPPDKYKYKKTLKYVRTKLGQSNFDILTLFDFYDRLPNERKKTLMQELLDNYDHVVQNKTKKRNNLT